jgi:Zn finger protein HypA/HybF involved in hydrogenase expression
MCESILDAVERRAAGRRVTRVRVRIGTLHRVVEPALDQAFSLVSGGTAAGGATEIDLSGGDELTLESIQLAAPDASVIPDA